MTDVLVRLIDLVDKLRNVDIIRIGIVQALVKTLLQRGIVFLLLGQLILQTGHPSLRSSQFFLGILIVSRELSVFLLAVFQVFFTCARSRHEQRTDHGCHHESLESASSLNFNHSQTVRMFFPLINNSRRHRMFHQPLCRCKVIDFDE